MLRHTDYKYTVTLSGQPEPVFIPRPVELKPFADLPDGQKRAVIRHVNSYSGGMAFLLALLGGLCGGLWYLPAGTGDPADLLRDSGIGAAIAVVLYTLWFLWFRLFRVREYPYVWFAGTVDDVMLCTDICKSYGVFLSVSGIEFPVQRWLIGIAAEHNFDGSVRLEIRGADWLRGAEIIVMQERDKIGAQYSTLMLFPGNRNRITEFSIIS